MQSGVTESKRGGKAMERLLAQLASKQGLCLQSKDNLQKTLIQIKHVLKKRFQSFMTKILLYGAIRFGDQLIGGPIECGTS